MSSGRGCKAIVATCAIALGLLLLAPHAIAAPLTFTVDDNGDEADQTINGICATAANKCTLRAAIQEANANSPDADTIDFAPGVTGSIVLSNLLPVIAGDLTVDGPGADQLAVDGDNSYRVLEAQNGTTTAISGLTIRQGQAPNMGGGAFGGGVVSGGDMTLDRVLVADNHAVATAPMNSSAQAEGAGILVGGGTLTLLRSTVRNNNANANVSGTGQAFSYGGGIAVPGGTLRVNRSTINDNQANATVTSGSGNSVTRPHGGGIYTYGSTTTITGSTINNNSATGDGGTHSILADFAVGGGIYQDNVSTLTVTGSTISGNSVGVPQVPNSAGQGANLELLSGGAFRDTIVADPVGAENCVGTFTSNGYNLEDDATNQCGFTKPTDIAGKNPMLNSLAANGGPTHTQSLRSGSPAIDKGNSFGATTDQRGAGFPRISNSPTVPNAAGGDGSDIGAFERNSTAPHKPAILGSNPASPANENHPKLRGLAQTGSVVKIYKTANCKGTPLATGSAATFRSPGLPVSIADNTSTTFKATATNSLHNTSQCSSGFTYREDSRAPNTTIDSLKLGHAYNTATVTFSSDQAGSTFKCRIDAQPYAGCTSPKKWAGLPPGPHTIRVFAIDKAGNADPTPARQSFTM